MFMSQGVRSINWQTCDKIENLQMVSIAHINISYYLYPFLKYHKYNYR